MPVTKTAKRALRSSLKKRVQNQAILKKIDILKRVFKKKLTKDSFSQLVSEIDKAVKKKVMHKNKAARIKSRFSKLLQQKTKTNKRVR